MPQDIKTQDQPVSLPLKEIGALLVKHFNYHEGLYEVVLSVNVAVGNIGPSADQILPGAMFGVSGIGLAKTDQTGPNTVDAATINPAKAPRKRKPKQK